MVFQTRTLSVGDPAPLLGLPTPDGEPVILADRVGQPIVLLFYANDSNPKCQEVARQVQAAMAQFEALNVHVLSISLDAPDKRQQFRDSEQLTFPVLSDASGQTSRKYGVFYNEESEDPNQAPYAIYSRTAFLLDRNLKIMGIYSLGEPQQAIASIFEDISQLPQEEPREIGQQAPVLLIPRVLSPEVCQHLIELWEGDNSESGSMRREGNKTIGVINYSHKIRRDHFIKDMNLLRYLDGVMRRRVFTEIKKAFSFEVTRREDYRIGGYDSSRGGYFRPHRDNTTGGTAHRRFAMSLNLNTGEYEGGYLRFPEYGGHLYRPGLGSAVIFSCSLMHEATDVTAGRRFGLFSFLYGDKEAQQRREYELQAQNNYQNMVKIGQDVPEVKNSLPPVVPQTEVSIPLKLS